MRIDIWNLKQFDIHDATLSHGSIFAAKMLHDRGTPFRRIILLEPTLFDLDIKEEFIALEKRVRISNKKRPRVWPSIEAAMEYYRTRAPWTIWHPEVLELMSVSSISTIHLSRAFSTFNVEIDLPTSTEWRSVTQDHI